MAIKITDHRPLPTDSKGPYKKDPNSLRSIMEGMLAGQSFFLKEDGDTFTKTHCSTTASLIKKDNLNQFAIRNYTENGVPGFVVYCLGKPDATVHHLRAKA